MLHINQTPPTHERDCYRDLGRATGAGLPAASRADEESEKEKKPDYVQITPGSKRKPKASSEGHIKQLSSLFENVYTHLGAKTATHTSDAEVTLICLF